MALADIGAGIGSLGAGIANLAGAAGSGGMKYYKKALEAWKKLKESDFDFRELSAPELKMVAEFAPQVYEAIVPQEMQQIAGSPEMRTEQLESLADLREVARRGTTDVDRLQTLRAQRAMAQQGRRSRENILRNLAARGQLGGGDELAARLAGQQSAANLAGDMGASLAEQAALRRLAATGQAAGLAGDVRGQDVGEQATNAQLAQRFNELVYGMLNQAEARNAAARQQAEGYNVGTQQQIADTNEMSKYQTALANLNRKNALLGQQWQQQYDITQGLTGAYGGVGQAKDREQANRMAGIQGLGEGFGQAVGGVGDLAFGGFGF